MASVDKRVSDETEPDTGASGGQKIVNWTLALLTIVGAAAVVGFAYLQVLGSAACSDNPCARAGPGETIFGLLLYGPPVVAGVTILLSFFTAGRRRGIVVPVIAWLLLAIGFVILVVSFQK